MREPREDVISFFNSVSINLANLIAEIGRTIVDNWVESGKFATLYPFYGTNHAR